MFLELAKYLVEKDYEDLRATVFNNEIATVGLQSGSCQANYQESANSARFASNCFRLFCNVDQVLIGIER